MSKFENLIAITIVAIAINLPQATIAQGLNDPSIRNFLIGDTSQYTAAVTLLKDHPECNGPAQTAISVSMNADALDFTVRGGAWDGYVRQFSQVGDNNDICVAGNKEFGWGKNLSPEEICTGATPRQIVMPKERNECYMTTRRGGEAIKHQISCGPNEDLPSLNELIEDAEIQLNFNASAEICHGLTEVGFLDSDWTITLIANDIEETFTGKLIWGAIFGVNPDGHTPLHDGPKVGFQINQRFYSIPSITPEQAVGPSQLDPMRSGNFSIGISFNNVPSISTPDAPISLDAGRSFRIKFE